MKKLLLPLAFLLGAATGLAEDNATKLALAREAISAMKADRTLDSMSGMLRQVATQQAQLPATATPAQRAQFEAYMAKVMDLAMSEAKTMISKMDVAYAEVYSEAELKAIIAFFKSPEGESMMAKQPQVMARIMPLMQEMQQSMGPKLQALIEEFKGQMAASEAAPATPPTK